VEHTGFRTATVGL